MLQSFLFSPIFCYPEAAKTYDDGTCESRTLRETKYLSLVTTLLAELIQLLGSTDRLARIGIPETISASYGHFTFPKDINFETHNRLSRHSIIQIDVRLSELILTC